jgi:hypothetical protein
MLTLLSRRGALVACGSALALVATVLPAKAAISGWRAAATVAINGLPAAMSGIDAVTAADAWAVGAAANPAGTKQVTVIAHWTGKSWKRVVLPAKVAKVANSQEFLFDLVAASSSKNVWVFGELPGLAKAEIYLHFNGRTWATGRLPGTGVANGQFTAVTAAIALGRSDVWVFGGKVKTSGATQSVDPYAAEFNGRGWSTKSVPGSGEVTAASAVSATSIWAVVGTSALDAGLLSFAVARPSVIHWNGTSWRAAAAQPTKLPAGASLTAVTAGPGDAVWIAGTAATSTGTAQFTDKLTGSSWQAAPADLKDPASGSSCGAGLAPDGHGGLWALELCVVPGAFKLWHLTGRKWSGPASPKFGASKAELFQLAAVPGTGSTWAAGAVLRGKGSDGLIGIYGPNPR